MVVLLQVTRSNMASVKNLRSFFTLAENESGAKMFDINFGKCFKGKISMISDEIKFYC